jgi:hypothetical protein
VGVALGLTTPHFVMEELLCKELGLKALSMLDGLQVVTSISNGQSYHTDKGAVFVKSNQKDGVCLYS